MRAYSELYLEEVVENQGKLFDFVAQNFPDKDTKDFIQAYMTSKTRKWIDESQAYVNTMNAKELWNYFLENDKYELKTEKTSKDLCQIGLENFMLTTNGITIFQVLKSSKSTIRLFNEGILWTS